jgi:hypothetical protein
MDNKTDINIEKHVKGCLIVTKFILFLLWLFVGGIASFIPLMADNHNEIIVALSVLSWLVLPASMYISSKKNKNLALIVNGLFWAVFLISSWLMLG